MAQSTDMLRSLIEGELARACYRRPTKRLALRIALSLLGDRHHPLHLHQALWQIDELQERVKRAKV